MLGHLAFNSTELLYGLLSLALGLLSFISYRKSNLSACLGSIDFNSSHFMIGISLAIASMVLIVNWETELKEVIYEVGDTLEENPLMTTDIPITFSDKVFKQPPVVPKKKAKVIDLVKIDIVENIDAKEEDVVIDHEPQVDMSPIIERDTGTVTPMILPPTDEKSKEPELFRVVEQMPRFPGCEDSDGSDKEKEQCAKEKMLQYIYKHLKYPAIASENGVQGMAVLQFVVQKDGSVGDINIVRDPGAGCGKAAEKVVEGMNSLPQKWTPGKQRGRPVKVLYTLPVKFRIK